MQNFIGISRAGIFALLPGLVLCTLEQTPNAKWSSQNRKLAKVIKVVPGNNDANLKAFFRILISIKHHLEKQENPILDMFPLICF